MTLKSQTIADSKEFFVAAAADMAPLEKPLSAVFRVRFIVGSSGMLARQIEQGAPYDVYLSANRRFVDDLAHAGKLLPDSVRAYAVGRVGLWSASGKIRTLGDLREPGVRHIAIPNPIHAPYGVAAKEVLEKQGLWKELAPRIVYAENVRQALEYAASGNAEAVITSWSLLLHKRGAVLLPDTWHAPLVQAGGIVKGTPREKEARRFLDFLAGPQGRKLLLDHGLSTPSDAPGRTPPSGR